MAYPKLLRMVGTAIFDYCPLPACVVVKPLYLESDQVCVGASFGYLCSSA